MDRTQKLATWRAAAARLDADGLAGLILDLDDRRAHAARDAGLPIEGDAEIPLLIVYLHDHLAGRAGAEAVQRATELSLGVRLSSDLASAAADLHAAADRFTALGHTVEAGLLALAASLGPGPLSLRVTQADLPELGGVQALVIEHRPPRLMIDLHLPDLHRLRLSVAPQRRRQTRTVKGLFGSREETVEVVTAHATAERWYGENCLEDHIALPALAAATGEALQREPAEAETRKSLDLLGILLKLPALVGQAMTLRRDTLKAALVKVGG